MGVKEAQSGWVLRRQGCSAGCRMSNVLYRGQYTSARCKVFTAGRLCLSRTPFSDHTKGFGAAFAAIGCPVIYHVGQAHPGRMKGVEVKLTHSLGIYVNI